MQRGRPQAAAQALRRALANTALRLLDGVETARSAASELDTIATNASPALWATADFGAAAVALADGALGAAEQAARHARSLFDEVDLAYGSARVATLLGRVLLAQGDADGARVELTKASRCFESIGVDPRRDEGAGVPGLPLGGGSPRHGCG